MGIYLNPGNDGFAQSRRGRYVDKSGIISVINEVLGTNDKLTCVSRPRRFGKTLAAKMLCAYYDKNCDSRSLFEGLEIEQDETFEKHLNRYNVIYLDITWFISQTEKQENIVAEMQESVIRELRTAYPGCVSEEVRLLPTALSEIHQKENSRFFSPCGER